MIFQKPPEKKDSESDFAKALADYLKENSQNRSNS